MPKKSPKMMFLIECKDFFYCVPEKDVLSADIASVMAGHKVSFKYGNLTQSDGTVLLVDGEYLFPV